MRRSFANFISVCVVFVSLSLALALPAALFRLPFSKRFSPLDEISFSVKCIDSSEIRSLSLEEYVIAKSSVFINKDDEEELIKAVMLAEKNCALKSVGALSESKITLLSKENIDAAYDNFYKEIFSGISDLFIVYDGGLAYTPYHRSSYEYTLESKEYPYLKEVSTPEAPIYRYVEMSYSELHRRLSGYLGVELVGDCTGWIRGVKVDSLGRAISVSTLLSDIPIDDFSDALGLDTRRVFAECHEKKVSFTLIGEGDGIGMSVEGARILAERGYSYSDIICHYYDKCNIYSSV